MTRDLESVLIIPTDKIINSCKIKGRVQQGAVGACKALVFDMLGSIPSRPTLLLRELAHVLWLSSPTVEAHDLES